MAGLPIVWDFSYFKPSVAQIKAAGVSGLVVYVVPDGRGISAPQLRVYVDAQIPVAFVHELGNGSNVDDGYNAGVAAARMADNYMTGLGLPRSVPCYYALDIDVAPTPEEFAAIYEFWLGASSIGRPAGIYAEADVLIYLALHGVSFLWEAGAYSWSQFRHCDKAVLRQLPNRVTSAPGVGRDSVDDNYAFAVNWGQYPQPVPAPTPDPGDDDVPYNDWPQADREQLAKDVANQLLEAIKVDDQDNVVYPDTGFKFRNAVRSATKP